MIIIVIDRMSGNQCAICSYMQPAHKSSRPVYHNHFSTQYLRKLVGPGGSDPASYACPSCMVTHSNYDKDARVKILVTDSTLHQYWLPKYNGILYEGDSIHVDQISIPGAKGEELRQAWIYEYCDQFRSMDVLLVAGLNNILRPQHGEGFAGTHLMQEFKEDEDPGGERRLQVLPGSSGRDH